MTTVLDDMVARPIGSCGCGSMAGRWRLRGRWGGRAARARIHADGAGGAGGDRGGAGRAGRRAAGGRRHRARRGGGRGGHRRRGRVRGDPGRRAGRDRGLLAARRAHRLWHADPYGDTHRQPRRRGPGEALPGAAGRPGLCATCWRRCRTSAWCPPAGWGRRTRRSFLEAGAVAVAMGGNLVGERAVNEGRWTEIEANARSCGMLSAGSASTASRRLLGSRNAPNSAHSVGRCGNRAGLSFGNLECGKDIRRQRDVEIGCNPHLPTCAARCPTLWFLVEGHQPATGLPALAMITSSPRRTRASNRERCVFASPTLP